MGYVLYRDSQGRAIALSNQCPHRGAALHRDWVEDNCLRCPYHGWMFDASGTCVDIPADLPGVPIPKRAKVATYPVQEQDGMVWLYVGETPEAAVAPIPHLLPELGDPRWRAVYGEYTWNAHYTRVIESNLDVSHAAFVHPPFYDNRDRAAVDEYEVTTTPYSATATVNAPAPKRRTFLKYLLKEENRYSLTTITVYLPTINRIEIDFSFRGYKYIAIIPDYDMKMSEWEAEAVLPISIKRLVGLWRWMSRKDAKTERVYRVCLPNITFIGLKFDYFYLDTFVIYLDTFVISIPVSPTVTVSKWALMRNFLKFPFVDAQTRNVGVQLLSEDERAVKTQDPLVCPFLNNSTDLLQASDGTVIAYRRLLKKCYDLGWWQEPSVPAPLDTPSNLTLVQENTALP